ncbi:MAG: hypothetical protein QXS85_05760 [Acidilobaceae archaeon]
MARRRLYLDQRDVETWARSRDIHAAIAALALLYALVAATSLASTVAGLLDREALGVYWSPGLFDALACATVAGLYAKAVLKRSRAESVGYAVVGVALAAALLVSYTAAGIAGLASVALEAASGGAEEDGGGLGGALLEAARPEVVLGLLSLATGYAIAKRVLG